MNEQLDLLDKPRRCILISLHPQYFDLLCSGEKKYEYRRSSFVKESVDAFVYCTSPVMQVKAFIRLGTPITGTPEEIAKIKDQEVSGSFDMMMEWLDGRTTVSAFPIEKVTTFDLISLEEIRNVIPDFYPPQNFIYVDSHKKLNELLQQRLL